MKRNKFFLASAAITALTLTACTDKDEFSQADLQKAADEAVEGQIQFGTYMGKASTRAWSSDAASDATASAAGKYNKGVINTTMLQKQAEFGVFAYQTGSADWQSNTYAPLFMYNQYIQAKWEGATPDFKSWVYDPVKYWPNGIDAGNADNDPSNTATENAVQKLSFFAYAPYTPNVASGALDETTLRYPDKAVYGDIPTGLDKDHVFKTVAYDATATNIETRGGVLGMTDWNTAKDPWINFYLPNASTAEGVDLLWGVRGQYTYDETDGADNTQTDKLGNTYNVNLTKQAVPEKVRFLFKHALAKIFGSTKDESKTWKDNPKQSGIQVVVDIDANSTNPNTGTSKQTDYFTANFNNNITLVTLKDVKIRDGAAYGAEAGTTLTDEKDKLSNLHSWGWFNIATGEWTSQGSEYNKETSPYKSSKTTASLTVDNSKPTSGGTTAAPGLNARIKEIGVGGTDQKAKPTLTGWDNDDNNQNTYPVGVKTTPTPVYDNNESYPGIMIIPSNVPQTLYVTVDYIVRTADKQLAKGYSEVEQIITNSVDLKDLEPNKYYTLVIHLGLTSVKFEAIVADWAMTDNATYNEDGSINETVDNTHQEGKSIWLPSNVVNSTQISADAGSSHKSVTIDAAATTYTVHLTNLTAGNKLAWDAADNVAEGSLASYTGTEADVTLNITQNWTSGTKTQTVEIKELTSEDVLVSTTRLTIVQQGAVLSLVPNKELLDATENLTVVATLAGDKLISGLATTHLTVSPTQGSTPTLNGDGKTFEIGQADNTGTTNQVITVTVDLGTGNVSKAITVKRKPKPLKINSISGGTSVTYTLATTTLALASSDAIDVAPTYTVTSAGDDVIDMPAPNGSKTGLSFACNSSWLSVNQHDGRLYASANNTAAARTATVTIIKDDASVSFTVTQPAPTPSRRQ